MSTVYQRSFAAGEVSPAVYGRPDLVKNATGLKKLRSMYTTRDGGVTNRPGSIYKTEVKDMTKVVRLIPFEINDDISYALEFGDGYVRPLYQGEPIAISAVEIILISKAASASISTLDYHGLSTGDIVLFAGVVGMTEINGLTGTVTVTSSVSFTVNINSTGFSNYVSGGNASLVTPRNVELVSPYAEADLFEVTYTQAYKTLATAHQSAMPKEIKFFGHQYWTITDASVAPSISAPGSPSLNGAAAGTTYGYVVTAVKRETGEESLPSSAATTSAAASAGAPINFTWSTVSGASAYNVYKSEVGSTSYGFLAVAYGAGFSDKGTIAPDYDDQPPQSNEPIFDDGSDTVNLPAAVGSFQQRRFYGNIGPAPLAAPVSIGGSTVYDPRSDRILASRIGGETNFTLDIPVQDDSAISIRLLGRRLQEIRHFLDVGKLAVFSKQGVWVLDGDTNGAITPLAPNPKQVPGLGGASYVPPLALSSSAVYVGTKGNRVLSFGFDFQVDGYRGPELSVFSSHLLKNTTVVDWAFQDEPHSVLWMVRNDGALLGMTYVPDQQLVAWHQHDFENGVVESVCSISEGNEDVVYLSIRREIDGSTVRYIERLANRVFSDIKDAIFVDSCFTYDGRNTGNTTMTLSGGTTWAYDETITLTASASYFVAGDVGKEIHLRDDDGNLVRFSINAYTSGTVVTGRPDRTVPESLQEVSTTDWAKAVFVVTGLDHLEGEDVAVQGDGYVVSNPNNPDYQTLTVSGGEIDLGDIAFSVIHVGLPILAEMETLDLKSSTGNPLIDVSKLTNGVSIRVEDSRGIWAGASIPDDGTQDVSDDILDGLTEYAGRTGENYDEPIELRTGVIHLTVDAQWTNHGRVRIVQVDPGPITVLAIAPQGFIPGG